MRAWIQQKAYLDRQTPNPTSTRSHATEQDEIDEDEIIALAPAVPGQGRKRHLDTRVEGLDGARKRSKPEKSSHEKRLLPDFEQLKKVTPIGVPTYEGGWNHKTGQNTGASMRPFKPMNTLDDAPHASRSSPRNAPQPATQDFDKGKDKRGDVQDPAQLPLIRSTGSNVVAMTYRSNGYGEGFDSENGRSAKKLKTGHSSPATRSSPVVDLTGEPEGRPSVLSSTVNKNAQRFADNPIKKLDYTLNGKPKNPRKVKAGRASQSSQTPSVVEIDGGEDAARATGARDAPVSVDESPNEPRQQLPGQARRTITQSGVERPEINLTRGYDEVKTKSGKQGDAADLRSANDVMSAHAYRNARATQSASNTRSVHQPRSVEQSNGTSGLFAAYGKQREQQRAKSPKLSRIFVREEGADVQPRQKAKDRMMERSENVSYKVSPHGDGFSSDDALQSGNTVGSRARHGDSPQKAHPRHSPEVRVLVGSADKRTSPSDLRPTKFTQQRSKQSPSKKQMVQQRPQEEEDERLDSDIMPIQAFYASSCVLTHGNISLRYDPNDKHLDVYEGDQPIVMPGKKRIVSIGEAEAHTVSWSNGSNRVFIQGSLTDVSNGRILIAFADEIGVKWIIGRLHLVTESHVITSHVTRDRLDKVFGQQTHELRQLADRVRDRALVRVARSKIPTQYGIEQIAAAESDDDDDNEIRLEANDHEQRQSMRKRMRAGDEDGYQRLPKNAHEPEVSPYWPGSTRKSTRKTKPVQERAPSPSPERWTRVNTIKRWSQPVIYPAQGARRVTVEFSDIERLDEGQFLNDNVISFALRQIEEQMAPELRDSVHFFNSFFYSSLTAKNGKKAFNYDAVKRWTKGKDLFTVPYVVVPICIDLHWFVAIICNLPNLERKLAGVEEETEPDQQDIQLHEAKQVEEIDNSVELVEEGDQESRTKQPTEAMHKLSLTEDVERPAPGDDNGGATGKPDQPYEDNVEVITTASSRPSTATSKKSKSRKKTPPQPRRYESDTPSIVTLDSFGSSHTTEIRYLKEYLKAEAEAKRSIALDREQLSGITAKGIPEQTNFCDCGVYLIGYVEEFAKDPRGFMTKALNKKLDEQADFATFNPSAKRAEIREELLKISKEQEDAHQAKKRAKRDGAQGTAGSAAKQSPEKAKATITDIEQPNVAGQGDVDKLTEPKAETAPATSVVPERPDVPRQRRTEEVAKGITKDQATGATKLDTVAFALTEPPPAIQDHNTSRNADDEADELEAAVARPLGGQPNHQEPPGITQDERSPQRLESADCESTEESEMLDNGTDGAAYSNVVQPPSTEHQFLDEFEQVVEASDLSQPAPAVLEEVVHEKSVKPRVDEDNEESLEEIKMLNGRAHGGNAPAEVPDSQEMRYHWHPTQKLGGGKHTKFAD